MLYLYLLNLLYLMCCNWFYCKFYPLTIFHRLAILEKHTRSGFTSRLFARKALDFLKMNFGRYFLLLLFILRIWLQMHLDFFFLRIWSSSSDSFVLLEIVLDPHSVVGSSCHMAASRVLFYLHVSTDGPWIS